MGPLALRDSVNRMMSEHGTRTIYKFAEKQGKFDLSLRLAIKSSDMPAFEFMQGDQVLTAQCTNEPSVVDDGDNFIICPCSIQPKKTTDFCSIIVDTPSQVKFAYKLLGWNHASEE